MCGGLPQRTDGLVLYQGEFSEVQLVNSMIQQLVEERHGIPVTIKDQMTAKNNFAGAVRIGTPPAT